MMITAHHVGCAVRQIEQSAATYARAFGLKRRTRAIEVPSQAVRVAFLELQKGFYLELVEPLGTSRGLANFMKVGFYHVCFLVEDLDQARATLRAQGFTPMPPFASPAFSANTCQFFLNPQLHLIEVAHMAPSAFAQFFEENLDRSG